MADIFTHVLVGYILGTIRSCRSDRMGPHHVTFVLIGALSPDFVNISLVFPDEAVQVLLFMPFSWSPLHTLGVPFSSSPGFSCSRQRTAARPSRCSCWAHFLITPSTSSCRTSPATPPPCSGPLASTDHRRAISTEAVTPGRRSSPPREPHLSGSSTVVVAERRFDHRNRGVIGQVTQRPTQSSALVPSRRTRRWVTESYRRHGQVHSTHRKY